LRKNAGHDAGQYGDAVSHCSAPKIFCLVRADAANVRNGDKIIANVRGAATREG